MSGPAPKDPSVRARRNKATTRQTLTANHGIAAPALPELGFLPLTVARWEAIWASPMASAWMDSDIPGLIDLARLWDASYRAEDAATLMKVAGEIRLQEARFGLDPLARRRMEWQIPAEDGRRVQAKTPVKRSKASDPRLVLVS